MGGERAVEIAELLQSRGYLDFVESDADPKKPTLTLGLQATGVRVLEAVNARDLDALLVAGDELDLACENCHVRYWYPSLEGQANTR